MKSNPVTNSSIQEVGAFEAKTHLSALLEEVSRGQIYFITKHGKRIAEIRPYLESKSKDREAGTLHGRLAMGADFDAPLVEFEEYS